MLNPALLSRNQKYGTKVQKYKSTKVQKYQFKENLCVPKIF